MECISYALDYFSTNDGETIKAVFFKHDGYLGALGCLLKSIEEEGSEIKIEKKYIFKYNKT